MLLTIGHQRRALDVAGVRDRHHHVFARDQVFILDIAFTIHNRGTARNGEIIADLDQFLADNAQDALA